MKKILLSTILGLLLSHTLFAQVYAHCSEKSRFLDLSKTNNKAGLVATEEYDVHFYKLDLHLERNTTFIEGNVSMGAKVVAASLDTIVLELHSNFTIDSIYVDGKKNTFSHPGHLIKIPVTPSFSQGNNFTTQVFYRGTAPSSGSAAIGEGFSTGASPSWGNEVTWSLSQPFSAYEWFPVKQLLSDKADSSEVWVTTSSDNKVGSNGILKNTVSLPGNMVRYEWKSTYPIDYYLISVSVAKYVDYTIYARPKGLNDSIMIVNYIYDNPMTLPNFKTEIDKTAPMINVFSEKFGLYPFHSEKYGHCMAPFSGGMEHQTMTTQGFFFTDLTSHELAHQWFGDAVTCGSWKDISMNEGFASYSELVYIEEKEAWRRSQWLDDTHSSALQTSGSVYVDDTTDVSRIFSSSLTYNKGAFMLHMLRYEINDDSLFFGGLRSYRQQYSGSTATGKKFKAAMEQFTGMDFEDFFNQWYFGQGFPIYNLTYAQTSNKVILALDQAVTAPTITPLFKGHLDVKLTYTDRPDTIVRLKVSQNYEIFTIEGISGSNLVPVIDPDQWVLNDVGNVVYDPSLGEDKSSDFIKAHVFPNPSSGKVEFQLDRNYSSVKLEIFKVSGELLFMREYREVSSFSFNPDLASGAYIARITTSGGTSKEFTIVRE